MFEAWSVAHFATDRGQLLHTHGMAYDAFRVELAIFVDEGFHGVSVSERLPDQVNVLVAVSTGLAAGKDIVVKQGQAGQGVNEVFNFQVCLIIIKKADNLGITGEVFFYWDGLELSFC